MKFSASSGHFSKVKNVIALGLELKEVALKRSVKLSSSYYQLGRLFTSNCIV